MFRLTLLTRLFNERGMRLQRQGRIGFFAPSTGQEVAQVAGAAAFTNGVVRYLERPALLLAKRQPSHGLSASGGSCPAPVGSW